MASASVLVGDVNPDNVILSSLRIILWNECLHDSSLCDHWTRLLYIAIVCNYASPPICEEFLHYNYTIMFDC